MSRAACVLWCAAGVLLAGLRNDTVHAATGTLADSSGQVVGWGDNSYGQLNAPSGNFIATKALLSVYSSLGLTSDGTLAGWGQNSNSVIGIPSGTFTALAAGGNFGVAIKSDGTL